MFDSCFVCEYILKGPYLVQKSYKIKHLFEEKKVDSINRKRKK